MSLAGYALDRNPETLQNQQLADNPPQGSALTNQSVGNLQEILVGSCHLQDYIFFHLTIICEEDSYKVLFYIHRHPIQRHLSPSGAHIFNLHPHRW